VRNDVVGHKIFTPSSNLTQALSKRGSSPNFAAHHTEGNR
jgi:hypothetical protein